MEGTIKIGTDAAQLAAECLANGAIETNDANMALQAIRLYDALRADGYDSAVKYVLTDLARIAHVDL